MKKGGDTDTNAAIVGALIGAYTGFEDLKNEWKEKVLSRDKGKNSSLIYQKVKEKRGQIG